MHEEIDNKLIIPGLFTVSPDTTYRKRFMIVNGYYWFSDNEIDCDDRDPRREGEKPQFIKYSWVWKDNLWSITEVTLTWRSEGQTQEYGWDTRGQRGRQALSFSSVNTDTSVLAYVYVYVQKHTRTHECMNTQWTIHHIETDILIRHT